MSDKRDVAVAELARRQHGLWTRQQAVAIGITPSMIRTRLGNGLWLSIDTAVYGALDGRATWARSVMAGVLAEPWAVASHRSAAVLHKLVGFRQGRPEITVRPGANVRGRLAIAHRGIDVPSTRIDDIPVVTLAQVFIDLCQIVSEIRLRTALSARADVSRSDLDAIRDRYCALAPRGGRDLRMLRRVLASYGAGDVPTPSELERALHAVLGISGIPPIRWEAPFPGRRPGKQRVDCLIPSWSMVGDDGRAWHTRLEDFERDRRRDAEAAAAGFQTLRFTWYDLTQKPDWVREMVLSTGRHRSAA